MSGSSIATPWRAAANSPPTTNGTPAASAGATTRLHNSHASKQIASAPDSKRSSRVAVLDSTPKVTARPKAPSTHRTISSSRLAAAFSQRHSWYRLRPVRPASSS